MENYTVDGLENYIDLEDNRNYLTKPLLVHTRFWNTYVGITPNAYTCYFVEIETSTDGASLPRLAIRILGICPRDKQIFFAGLLHDNLYQKKQIRLFKYNKRTKERGSYIGKLNITKSMADKNMRYETLKWGMNYFKSYFIWLGLKLGGGKAWRSYIKV